MFRTLFLFVLVTFSTSVFAAPSFAPMVAYLSDGDEPVDGTVQVDVYLGDSEEQDSTLIFSDTVLIVNGLLVAELPLDSVPLALSDPFLTVVIDDEALQGTIPVGKVLFSQYASFAEGVDWQNVSGVPDNLVDGDDDTLYSAGVGLAEEDGTFSVAPDGITSAHILDGTVQAADLAPVSVGNSAIIPGSVTSSSIANNSVTSEHISSLAVGPFELQNNAVLQRHLANDSVTNDKIFVGAVRSIHLSVGSVSSNAIASNAVGASKIAESAVGSSEIATSAVGSSEIAANAVGSSEIATGAVGPSEIAAGAVVFTSLAANSVGSTALMDGAVTASDIRADAVGSSEIATGAVGPSEIAANAVTSSALSSNSVGDSEIQAGAVKNSALNLTTETWFAASSGSQSCSSVQNYTFCAVTGSTCHGAGTCKCRVIDEDGGFKVCAEGDSNIIKFTSATCTMRCF